MGLIRNLLLSCVITGISVKLDILNSMPEWSRWVGYGGILIILIVTSFIDIGRGSN